VGLLISSPRFACDNAAVTIRYRKAAGADRDRARSIGILTRPIVQSLTRIKRSWTIPKNLQGVEPMGKLTFRWILIIGILAVPQFVWSQIQGRGRAEVGSSPDREVTPGLGWKTCPRCLNSKQVRAALAQYKVEGHPFTARDLSGVWGDSGTPLDMKAVPAMTPQGEEMFEATRSEIPTTNSRDGMLICDPLGFPRWFAYNYGFEFVMLPDRVLQFFEWEHTWRTIWTDGRKLPEDPPQQRWLGYAVGHWEGDTFVVEGSGYDERSWLSEDRRQRVRGFPHSDKLTTVERYHRTSYGTMEAEITITDPLVFTKPWITKGNIALHPNAELWEYFCVPSESDDYNKRLIEAARPK
jgi:hypothetical protein